MNTRPEDLIRIGDKVPTLPHIFHRLNEAVNDPRSSMRDIAGIISTDQSLSARLLRIANSAFYGFPSRIETISRAVTIIGTQQLRDLALATSIVETFSGLPIKLVDMSSFWRHSIASGITARIMANYHRESNIERFFVAGLLHDIGRLLIYKHEPEKAREAIESSTAKNEPLFMTEYNQFGYDHGEVGGALLRHWGLPASLEEAVRYHHNPSFSKRFPLETATVHVSDIIANAMRYGSSGERFVPPLEGDAWEQLRLPVSILSPALEQIDRQFSDSAKLFLEDTN
ncbi:MAG: HDOD domain-containing protein [bacterium]|nr:HDOD domain-containing protein [bacterium]